jgi:hypothetical protein
MIMEEPLLIYKKKEIRKKMLALRRALSTDETDKMAKTFPKYLLHLPLYSPPSIIWFILPQQSLIVFTFKPTHSTQIFIITIIYNEHY